MKSRMAIRRRTALAAGMGGIMSLTLHRAGATTHEANLERFVIMRGALDGRLMIGFTLGEYRGVVNGKASPLFGVVSAVFSRYQAQNGGYLLTEFEQAYYTDLETGKALTNWKNPYTNKIVTVPAYTAPPAKLFMTPDLQFHETMPMPPSVQVHHFAQGPVISAREIEFIERVEVSVAPASGQPAFYYRDHTTLKASLSSVDRPGTITTGSDTVFQATCSWRPWLNMGERPGHLSAYGNGRFGVTLDDLPAAWREETARVRPELLKEH